MISNHIMLFSPSLLHHYSSFNKKKCIPADRPMAESILLPPPYFIIPTKTRLCFSFFLLFTSSYYGRGKNVIFPYNLFIKADFLLKAKFISVSNIVKRKSAFFVKI